MVLSAHAIPCAASAARSTRGLFLRLNSGCDAARHGTVAALATVVLHGVLGLAGDHGDLALTLVTLVFRADRIPLLTAFARRSDVFGISDQDGFAALALHRDHVVGADFLSLGESGDGFGAVPVFGAGASVDERSERAESGGRE